MLDCFGKLCWAVIGNRLETRSTNILLHTPNRIAQFRKTAETNRWTQARDRALGTGKAAGRQQRTG